MNILVVIALFAVPALGARLSPIPELLTESYIINGDDIDIADFPHQGSLRYFGRHSCGCALIGGKYVLTAAHCVGSSSYAYQVQFGSNNRNLGGELYDVDNIIKHPSYSQDGRQGFPNDIAILVLEEEVKETEIIKRIRMATSTDGDFATQECFITGWGLTNTGGRGSLPSTLQGAAINVLSSQECSNDWAQTRADYHVCVGGQSGPGSCNGDSGGPLTCKVGGDNVLVGLTSWGINGCYTFLPSVYARVSTYQSWVLENIEIEL